MSLLTHDTTSEPTVVKSIEISAVTNDVWRALTEPDKIAQWMGGARIESKWEIGGDITFTSEMLNFNKTYQDCGTALAVERFYSEAAYKHANFFWGYALTDMKNLLER